MERWKAIHGFTGLYEVSNTGRVRSLTRKDALGRIWRGRLLRLPLTGRYKAVRLRRDGRYWNRYVHCLVLFAFGGYKPAGREAAHINGVSTDNNSTNLAWKTHRANEQDKLKHGTRLAGDKHPSARLSRRDVARIRASTDSVELLSRKYKVSVGHTYGIRSGRFWKTT